MQISHFSMHCSLISSRVSSWHPKRAITWWERFTTNWGWLACRSSLHTWPKSFRFAPTPHPSFHVNYQANRVFILQLKTWVLVRSWLFYMQLFACLVSLWCTLEDGVQGVEVSTFYISSVEDQSHFGMPRGTEMSLALIEPRWIAFHSNSTLPYLQACTTSKFFLFISYVKYHVNS